MSVKLAIYLFLYSGLCSAKDTWIQVVGIDNNNPAQNYNEFYDESIAFSKACAENKNRQCLKFIDIDPKNAKNPDYVKKLNIKTNDYQGSPLGPHGEQAYNQMMATIKNAQSGDQILIAIQNHGAPPNEKYNARSTSCIYFSSVRTFCDQHIKELTKMAPAGVRIAFIVDGCYSGGFVNANNTNVCIVSSADQYQVGYAGTTHLWEGVLQKHINTLSDIRNYGVKYNSSLRLASQTMRVNRCHIFNEVIINSLSSIDLFTIDLISTNKFLVESCQKSPSQNIYDFDQLRRSLDAMATEDRINKISKVLCENQKVYTSEMLCSTWKKLIKNESDLKTVINSLESKKNYEMANQNLKKLFNVELDSPELTKLAQDIYLHQRNPNMFQLPDTRKVKSSDMTKINDLVNKRTMAYKQVKETEHKYNTDLEELKSKREMDNIDLFSFSNCFNSDFKETKSDWSEIAKSKPKLFFDDGIIKEAEECEKSFSLQ